MKRRRVKEIWGALTSFTKSESRGILTLLPLLIVLGVVIASLNKPRVDDSFPLLADRMEGIDTQDGSVSRYSQTVDQQSDKSRNSEKGEQSEQDEQGEQSKQTGPKLFRFDPNTIDYRGLRKLGFSQQDAAAIIKYRTKYNKRFELPTDFAACYQVTDSIFDRLEPYIAISAKFAATLRQSNPNTQEINQVRTQTQTQAQTQPKLFRFDPNTLDSIGFRRLGFSARQTQTILNYRGMIGRFRSVEEFGECYSVGERIEELRPYIDISTTQNKSGPLELNSATKQELVEVRGIGELTAERIIDYRKHLGGYYDIKQLAEVEGVTERNFDLFSKEIYVDCSKIQKIDINFATAEIMAAHPYMSGVIIRKALKYKQLKGGLRSIEEMIEDKILSGAEAEKLSHYLVFRPLSRR